MKKVLILALKIIVIVILVVVLFINMYQPFGMAISSGNKIEYASKTNLFYQGTFHTDSNIAVLSNQESQFHNEQTIPDGDIPIEQVKQIPEAKIDELNFIWLGHSSLLLQMQGLNILIDPVFSDYTSPVNGIGPKRFSKLPLDVALLEKIDIVVISHDHYDHLDYQTIKAIDDKVKHYYVPLGVENHLRSWNVDTSKITAMNWHDEASIDGLKIIATPGNHYSGRLPWRNNTTLWCGFIFKNDYYQTYYTGDTGYGSHFKEIYQRYGAMDLLILEAGQYDNAWANIHMLPKQWLLAINDLQAKWTLPVHWGAFSISNHAWDDPPRQITALAKANDLNVTTPIIGQVVSYSQIANFNQEWWLDVK